MECGKICIGERETRKFNHAQTLVLQFAGGAASPAGMTVRLANVHIPSSAKHEKKDSDVSLALRVLTGFVAASREAFGIICGDINEKNQSRMGDRLRNAEHGAGHWRYWKSQANGEGDQLVYTETLERQLSIVDEQWQTVFCRPHYMHGGFFLPTTAATQDAVALALEAIAGAAADLALLSKHVSK